MLKKIHDGMVAVTTFACLFVAVGCSLLFLSASAQGKEAKIEGPIPEIGIMIFLSGFVGVFVVDMIQVLTAPAASKRAAGEAERTLPYLARVLNDRAGVTVRRFDNVDNRYAYFQLDVERWAVGRLRDTCADYNRYAEDDDKTPVVLGFMIETDTSAYQHEPMYLGVMRLGDVTAVADYMTLEPDDEVGV